MDSTESLELGVEKSDWAFDEGRGLNLEPYWMPFTHNRYFKAHPRLFARAEGAYFYTTEGRQVFDAFSGLWCTSMGHCHPKIAAAIATQAAQLDYSPPFQMGHPKAFELAEAILSFAPPEMKYVFYTNSGSEAVDSALKIALAYHRLKGQASKTRIIGREKGYHGVSLAGISVGGMVANRKMFSPLLMQGVDHLSHSHDLNQMAFSRGMPTWGGHLALELERLVALHDASNIAAVIVEPIQGSAGVYIPPVGYLQKLRELCTKHGILLIFDEVICGFGRAGAHFGAQAFGVVPDMITFAKNVSNGAVPLGGVIVRPEIYEAFMTGPEWVVELFHGYTYSGHPLACAAGLAALEVYREEGMLQRCQALAPVLEDGIHSLKGEPNVVDVRNYGLAAAVELTPIAGKPGLRAVRAFEHCYRAGIYLRFSGESLVLAPTYISPVAELHRTIETLREAIRAVAAISE